KFIFFHTIKECLMVTKSTISIVALAAALSCANAFAVRVGNPRIVKELNKFYEQMEAEGRLHELSDHARSVCSCLKKGGKYDQDALIKAIREAQAHGYLVRAHAHPSLLAERAVRS